MDYMLKRWDRFTRLLEDGRICVSNNAAERALRGIALGRKSWLFCGSGFRTLYEAAGDGTPRIREAACWAHLRRDFHDIWNATGSPIAKDALDRIGTLYDIEREITGQAALRRQAYRTQPGGLPRRRPGPGSTIT